jgi:GGDEF domain-containing protein
MPKTSARFRASIQKESEAAVDGINPADLLVSAGSVLKELEDYNRNIGRRQHLQTAEFRNMVKMLTLAVGKVSAASEVNVSILSDIGKHVAIASELDDVRVMKARLSDCLTNIRKETERQQTENEATIRRLREGLDQAQKRSAAVLGTTGKDQGTDAVTGLPRRPSAEAALAEPGLDNARSFASVTVVDHLQILNTRFGREAGDEILLTFARMMLKQLSPGDRLFRWGGPVLMALLTGRTSLELVRSEMGRRMENRLEHTIQTPTRSVLIPISVRWCVFPIMVSPRLLYQRIDNFAARPAPAG